MDAQQFLAEFGHIANAPEGVTRLRELVLRLAVSGALIATDSAVDASPLLAAIEQQKREHSEKKKVIPKQALVSRAVVKAPPHWAVCRLGDLALTITGGGTPSKNHPAYWGGEIPWASVKDMKELKFLDDTEDHITEEGLKNSSSNLIPPGRVIVCTRMGLGKVAINRVALAINQDLKALELPKEVNSDFFLILYKTREVSGTGTTVSGIKQDKLLALPAALPPIEEQSRIVAKVDELMVLCDKLESQQQARRKLQNSLRQSTLQAVASATSPHELRITWARLADNFGQLFDAPEDVAELRSLVKDLAVRGLLTNQEIATQQFSENVDEIRHECERLRKLKGIRASRPVMLSEQFEEPFPLPTGWRWVSLDQICYQITDGAHHTPTYVESGVPFLSVKDVSKGVINFSATKFITSEMHAELSKRCNPEFGDLLLTKVGTTGIAKTVDTAVPFSIFVSLALLKFPHKYVEPSFLELLVSSPFVKSQSEEGTRGIGNKNLVLNTIKGFAVPLPPIAEQKRVLEKAKELILVCNSLESKIEKRNVLSARLAAATVASIAGIGIEKEEESMKAPQTELIAPLRLGNTPDIKAQAPLATILARHNGEISAKDLWQRFGGEIDAFYAQLKTEVAHGWILEPTGAEMREKQADAVSA